MKITIACVGKIKEKYLTAGIEEFSKRLTPFCKLETLAINEERMPDNPSPAEKQQVLERETQRLLAIIPANSYVILLDVIGKLRREIPNITLRTTLIAGFPGETEEQFEDLCNFVKEVQFDRLGCFAYSAEENTVAAKMDGQIEQEVKDKRAELVMQIQTGIMAQKQAAKVGQTVRVLCDGVDDESGLYLCRTAADAPEVDGNVCVSSEEPLYPGEFYDVLVDDSDLYDLYGTVAK